MASGTSAAGGGGALGHLRVLDLTGALLGEPMRMVKCESIDLEVPAEAELVLEGNVPPEACSRKAR